MGLRGYPPRPVEERLWEHVTKTDSCWVWTGMTKKGYGVISIPTPKRMRVVHRVAYETLVGPIPEGLTIDHLCRNRACVNPDHLEAVTNRENVLRGFGPTAIHARKTHCMRGHEFTPENTTYRKQGGRTCRACERARWLRNKDKYTKGRSGSPVRESTAAATGGQL